jgi:DNA polymerase III epsilon subunit-like protein
MPEANSRHRALLSGHEGSYIIFDLETTGKVTSGESADEIVEIAIIEVNCYGEEVFSWETTVKASK